MKLQDQDIVSERHGVPRKILILAVKVKDLQVQRIGVDHGNVEAALFIKHGHRKLDREKTLFCDLLDVNRKRLFFCV